MAYHDHVHWGASDGMLLTLTEGVVGWRKVPRQTKAATLKRRVSSLYLGPSGACVFH